VSAVDDMRPLLDPPQLSSAAAQRLADLLDPFTVRVRVPELEQLAERVDPGEPLAAIEALLRIVEQSQADRLAVRVVSDELRSLALRADEGQRQDLVVGHLRAHPHPGSSLRRDFAAATRGHLDIDCVIEREAAHLERLGTRLELLARVAPALVDRAPELDKLGRSMLLDALEMLGRSDRRPTRLAAIRALASVLGRSGTPDDESAFEFVGDLLRDPRADPWDRRAALEITRELEPDAAERWLQVGLSARGQREAWLVRARAVELALLRPELRLQEALMEAASDDSELVRFSVADGLGDALGRGDRHAAAMIRALRRGADERTLARLAWRLRSAGTTGLSILAELLHTAARPPRDSELVARTALDAAIAALASGAEPPELLERVVLELPPDQAPALRRRADLLVRHIQLMRSPLQALAAELDQLAPGEQATVRLPADSSALHLAAALTPHAAAGFGFHLDPVGSARNAAAEVGATVRVFRGDQPEPAAWRVLDELRQPAPAKRQAHYHSTGHADRGAVRVPPRPLAEATPTGVAGQRVAVKRQDGWAPELPMVEDLLHALRRRELVVVAAEGSSRVRAPRGPRRWLAWLRLTWSFRRYEQLRMAALEADDPALAPAWQDALRRLGFEVEHTPLRPRGPAGAGHARAWLDPLSFALGMGGSTLPHLTAVVLLLGLLLFGRLSMSARSLRRARRQIPLVMGGWGTRGKSGTERLKGGLLEALGVPFVSKTTGCEAMVLHAPPGGRAMELFLYRPYDKATIWEQADVASLAPALSARVLLWECMALNPRYVELLQGRWMHDDIATLTNAFPDHEDIQGPTGQDVATVIAGFAPPRSRLLTTEQNMLPILSATARARGTPVTVVAPNDAELMPADLLARFRHAEHPANVALVARLAEGLGVHRVEAIGWMAEHVVADVGALVLHAPVDTEGRTLRFAQGMSANDPLSFRHNWATAGYLDPVPAHEWRVSVVNNRADRIARSRMFAGLLADEAAAHRHVLIGTNLEGLRRYVLEAVNARLDRMELDTAEAAEALIAHLCLGDAGECGAAMARRLGAPVDIADAWAQAARALPPAAAPHWSACQQAARAIEPAAAALARRLPQDTGRYAAELTHHLVGLAARDLAARALRDATALARRALYRELVEQSLVLVRDAGSTGDQTIAAVVRASPPGAWVRLIGLQNIKGTGLDFAYRWVEWGEVHRQLEALQAAEGDARKRLLAELGSRAYGSVMACDGAWAGLVAEPDEPEVLSAREAIQARRRHLVEARAHGGDDAGPWGRMVDAVERILDPFDAIARRRRARWILGELAAGRMSHPRAQTELAALTTRQKGGWLRGKK